MIFFLFIQNLMSNSSLFGLIQCSNRKILGIAITILAIFGEVKCINFIYQKLGKVLDSNKNINSYNKMSNISLLYIVLYFAIYTFYVLLIILDYYF